MISSKDSKNELSNEDQNLVKELISDIKNHMIALGFEKIPEEDRIKDPNNSSMFAFYIIGHLLNGVFNPKPYEKIKISKMGPKNDSMKEVLKAALESLEKLDPKILSDAKTLHAKKYDLVITKLNGEKSLHSRYGIFSHSMNGLTGQLTNQPGLLVNSLVEKVENLFAKLNKKFKNAIK